MFKKLVFFILLASSLASAKEFTVQDVRERLEIHSDIYQVDGKKVVGGPERTNYWRMDPEKGETEGNWSSIFNGDLIAIRHNWKVNADGTIKVTIEEFANSSKEGEFSHLIEKKEFTLENLEPIVWKVKNVKDKSFIVRYIPSLREISKPIALESLPVVGTGLTVSDNAGFLWVADTKEYLDGKFVGLTTHRGTIALSYVPFKGAKEMGVAEGNQINLKVDKKFQINFKSETAFLPAGVIAKVYAVYLPEKKSKGVNSVHSFSSSSEERFQESLKR
ncbi:MAG TPA: hypothetical protein VIG33_12120 [Pseudobdellovibrionaceae bacterium]|jgi:hypothetical protein